MSVLQFATDVRELTPFTNKLSQIDHGLGELARRLGDRALRRHLPGLRGLGKQEGRKVLVLVSDGDDTAKASTYAQALEAALRNEVMIYSLIDVPIEASAGRDTGRRTRADHPFRSRPAESTFTWARAGWTRPLPR